MNQVTLYGNVSADPEMRKTKNGTSVATFSLATNESWRDDKGEKHENTEWHNIVIFGKQAEFAEMIIQKGTAVLISGKIRTRSWEKDDGTKAYRTEIVARTFTAGERRKKKQDAPHAADAYEKMGTGQPGDPMNAPKVADLPF